MCPYGSFSLHPRHEDRSRNPELKDSEERLPIRPLESGASTADSPIVGFDGAFGHPAAGRQRAERRVKCVLLIDSWPPVASKQTKASLSPAIFASSEWPSSVFRRRSRRPSLKQCRSSQSRETSKPMISGCGRVLILSSFWSAVPDGRMQLCEMMKRGGAGLLESVAEPQV